MSDPPKSQAEYNARRDELLERAKGFALQAVVLFTDEELREALDALALADSVGAIFDPTAYIRSAEPRERVKELFAALRRYRSSVEKMIEEDVERARAVLDGGPGPCRCGASEWKRGEANAWRCVRCGAVVRPHVETRPHRASMGGQ